MKNKTFTLLKSILPFLVLLGGVLLLRENVALAVNFQDILEGIGDKTDLPNYNTNVHADASTRSGAKNITSAIFFVIDFMKYILGGITVLMLIIHSIGLLSAGKESEEKVTKEKTFLKYALMGLVLVFVADEAVQLAFFGEEGEFLRNEEEAAEFAQAGSDIIRGIYRFVQAFLGSIAVLMIVYSGFQILVAAGSEEATTAAKKRIIISGIGLVVVGLSELMVKDVIFKDAGSEVDVERGREIVVGLTNFLSSVIGVIAVLAFVYAGFLYILNFGNDELTGKAKKIMFGALIGMVLAAAAFAIVSTIIPLEGAQ